MEIEYPTTEEYLRYLLEQVFSGFKRGMDTTIVTPPGLGIMPYILYFVNTRVLPISPAPLLKEFLGEDLYSKTILLPITPVNIKDNTFLNQFKLFINNNPNLNGNFPVDNIADLIRTVTEITAKGYRLLFILDTLKDPSMLEQQTLELLSQLVKLNANNINVVYSFNNIDIEAADLKYRAIYKNVKYLKLFSEADTKQQVARIFAKQNLTPPSDLQIRKIHEMSGGLAAFSKHFAQGLMDNPAAEIEYGEYENSYLNQIVAIAEEYQSGDEMSYLTKTGIATNKNLLRVIEAKLHPKSFALQQLKNLTLTEEKILKLLLDNSGQIVSRDAVAEAIWGIDASNKYSDWTIDKHLNNLKKKVTSLYQIETHKGRGFLLAVQ